jgi:hypothetical protein
MTHRPDDAVSKDLRNVGKLIPVYTALQPRRQAIFKKLAVCEKKRGGLKMVAEETVGRQLS